MSPQEELRYLILGAQREGNRTLAALLAPVGLTAAQSEVLTVLADHHPLTLVELGRRLVCETGSPSRLVDVLVRAGLVHRAAASTDRRRVDLTLTDQGASRATEVARLEAALVQRLHEIPESHLAITVETLRGLLADTAAGTALDLRRDT